MAAPTAVTVPTKPPNCAFVCEIACLFAACFSVISCTFFCACSNLSYCCLNSFVSRPKLSVFTPASRRVLLNSPSRSSSLAVASCAFCNALSFACSCLVSSGVACPASSISLVSRSCSACNSLTLCLLFLRRSAASDKPIRPLISGPHFLNRSAVISWSVTHF